MRAERSLSPNSGTPSRAVLPSLLTQQLLETSPGAVTPQLHPCSHAVLLRASSEWMKVPHGDTGTNLIAEIRLCLNIKHGWCCTETRARTAAQGRHPAWGLGGGGTPRPDKY